MWNTSTVFRFAESFFVEAEDEEGRIPTSSAIERHRAHYKTLLEICYYGNGSLPFLCEEPLNCVYEWAKAIAEIRTAEAQRSKRGRR